MKKTLNKLSKGALFKKSAQKKKTKPPKSTPPRGDTGKTLQKKLAQIGAEGEQQIYEVLIKLFGEGNVFKNVYIRRPSGKLTEVDLLAIHSTGVYVVESKNFSGSVSGDGLEREWVHTKSTTSKRSFYSPVAQNKGHIDALREACKAHLGFIPPMLSLLVFPDRCDLQIKNLPKGLRCCRTSSLPHVLSDVVKMVEPALNQVQFASISSLLYQSQRHMLPSSVQRQHMKDVAAAKRWARKSK